MGGDFIAATALLFFGIVRPEIVDSFEEGQFVFSGGRYTSEQFTYQLHRPEELDETQRYPMLIWLHGFGENGVDGAAHLRWIDRILPPDRTNFRPQLFVLALQCPPDNPTWTRGSSVMGDDMIEVVYKVAQKVISEQRIDSDRVFVAGVSSGGSGAWEIGIRHPQLFAAIAPIAAGPVRGDRLASLKDVPVWSFHNTDDPAASVTHARRAVQALKDAGGTAALTETSGSDHDAWTEAFREHHLMNWLLSQTRGQHSPRPGYTRAQQAGIWLCKAWDLPAFYVPVGLVLLAGWSAYCFWSRSAPA